MLSKTYIMLNSSALMKILEANVDIGMVLKSRCMPELQYDINE